MEVNVDSILFISLIAAFFLVAYFLLYKNYIYSIIDPLFLWVVTTAFASVLVVEVAPDITEILHFFCCQIFLWAGFCLAYSSKKNSGTNTDLIAQESYIGNLQFLKLSTYFFVVIYIMSNLIIGYVKGYAILTDEPSSSKIANYQQGFGLFRKINWSTGTYIVSGLTLIYIKNRKVVNLFLLFVIAIFYSLDGSKASLLQVLISVGLIAYHPIVRNLNGFVNQLNKYIILALVPVAGLFFVVLFKENSDVGDASFAFVRRLLYSADALLFYYHPSNFNFFDKYDFIDYVKMLFNPTLGFLRLQNYKETPGVIMLDNLFNSSLVDTGALPAPNTPFYIEAKIYFNYGFGYLFSFVLGYIYAKIRVYYFSISRSSGFKLVFFASLCHLVSAIIGDVNLAIVQINDLIFFVLIPSIILKFLFEGKVILKR